MMTVDILPPVGLVVIIGGFWGWGWLQHRRFRAAVVEAAARLNGRYEPGSHTSGGTLYGRYDERDVVFVFRLATTLRPETTTTVTMLKRPVRAPFLLRGGAAVSRESRLAPYASWFGRVQLGAESNQLWVTVPGVIRNSARLVELASTIAGLAAEIEAP